jgi:type IV secretory pathway VirJ component
MKFNRCKGLMFAVCALWSATATVVRAETPTPSAAKSAPAPMAAAPVGTADSVRTARYPGAQEVRAAAVATSPAAARARTGDVGVVRTPPVLRLRSNAELLPSPFPARPWDSSQPRGRAFTIDRF